MIVGSWHGADRLELLSSGTPLSGGRDQGVKACWVPCCRTRPQGHLAGTAAVLVESCATDSCQDGAWQAKDQQSRTVGDRMLVCRPWTGRTVLGRRRRCRCSACAWRTVWRRRCGFQGLWCLQAQRACRDASAWRLPGMLICLRACNPSAGQVQGAGKRGQGLSLCGILCSDPVSVCVELGR